MRSINLAQAKEEHDLASKHHDHLVEQARKVWKQNHAPKSKSDSNGGEFLYLNLWRFSIEYFGTLHCLVITNPEDPKFDLEKFLEFKSSQA